jgi:hypothetical protein
MDLSTLSTWVRSHISVMAVNIIGPEEQPTIQRLTEVFTADPFNYPVHVWHLGRGLRTVSIDNTPVYTPERDTKTNDPLDALRHIASTETPGVYVMVDLHKFLQSDRGDKTLEAELKFLCDSLKYSRVPRRIILLGEGIHLSSDLHRKVHHLEATLPDRERVKTVLDANFDRLRQNYEAKSKPFTYSLDAAGTESLVRAAQGLSEVEIGDETRIATIQGDGTINDATIRHFADYKAGIFRYYGVEFFERPAVDVGGVDILKSWCTRRASLFAGNAPAVLPSPKGIMLVGPTGTGKTHIAKSIASWWGVRALAVNIGAIMGSLVGESEHRMRDLLKLAEATAPVVLVIDEVEKAFAGVGGDTSGVTTRLFGQLLTWMAEKTAPVFVVCTANSIAMLPPEFTRKGRFDEVFFVDLPGTTARREIFELHLSRRSLVLERPEVLDLVVSESDGYTGAELEEVINIAALTAWNEERLELPLAQKDLMMALRDVQPLARREEAMLMDMRQQCQGARRASSEGG